MKGGWEREREPTNRQTDALMVWEVGEGWLFGGFGEGGREGGGDGGGGRGEMGRMNRL